MSTIVTRSGKGSPLTHTEVDNNFTNLNTDKLQSGDTAASLVITSADINGGTIDGATIGASSASTGAFTTLAYSSTLTGGTGVVNLGSGQFYKSSSGNVGIGTSSPKSYTNYNTVTLTGTNGGIIDFTDTATNSVRAEIVGDTTSLTLSGGANLIAFRSGSAERMRLDSSGNLGIGTSSPSSLGTLVVSKASSGTPVIALESQGSWNASISTSTSQAFIFNNPASTERMRITDVGNVGIGTSSPQGRMTLQGAAGTNGINQGLGLLYSTGTAFGALGLNNITGWPQLMARAGAGITFHTDSDLLTTNERMRIDSSGNLLVGTTSAAYSSSGRGVVEIYGSTNALIALRNATNNAYIQSFGNDFYINNNGSGITSFSNNGSERMRIDSSGALLINTTSALAERLDVRGTGNSDVALIQSTNASTFTSNVLVLASTRVTTNSTYNFLTCVIQGNSFRLHIRDSGNVVNTNNSYGAISDIKLKENIVDATSKLEKLNQVRVVNYNLKGEATKQIGVIAQEIEQIFPSMVEEAPDKDVDGNDLGTTTKSVKYSVFVPILIKAIQELKAEVDSLKAQISQ
jgi:hypothetical protein